MIDQQTDREEFERQHRGPVATPVTPTAPVAAPVPEVPTDQLDTEIATAEARLVALKAQKARTAVQEYPKVVYHADHAHPDNPVAPVTVQDKADEDAAKAHGWVHANPADAARSSETPNATQYTREDENSQADLPAQMALDQAARTGKPPVDLVVGSDAPDEGASHESGTGPDVSTAEARKSAKEAADTVKAAAERKK